MTELDPDISPLSVSFAEAYAFPADVDPRWRPFYEETLTQMRNEARGLPLGTVQFILLGEIAYLGLKLRAGEADGTATATELKNMREMLHKFLVEFNRMLTASDDKARTTLLVEIKNVLVQSAKFIKDPEERREVNRFWNTKFAELDV